MTVIVLLLLNHVLIIYLNELSLISCVYYLNAENDCIAVLYFIIINNNNNNTFYL